MLNQTTPKTENMIKATVSFGNLCCPNTVGTYYKTYSLDCFHLSYQIQTLCFSFNWDHNHLSIGWPLYKK